MNSGDILKGAHGGYVLVVGVKVNSANIKFTYALEYYRDKNKEFKYFSYVCVMTNNLRSIKKALQNGHFYFCDYEELSVLKFYKHIDMKRYEVDLLKLQMLDILDKDVIMIQEANKNIEPKIRKYIKEQATLLDQYPLGCIVSVYDSVAKYLGLNEEGLVVSLSENNQKRYLMVEQFLRYYQVIDKPYNKNTNYFTPFQLLKKIGIE